MTRARLRDLGIQVGSFPTGPNNAITDVPGVQVGHFTLIEDQPTVTRTGITVVLPREARSAVIMPSPASTATTAAVK